MITIDGKSYPLWSKFVENKHEWIGGTIEEDPEFPECLSPGGTTTITDISLSKFSEDSDTVVFTIHGKDFDESFNVEYGGVSGGDGDCLEFHVPMCSGFRIRKPKANHEQ